MSAPRAVLVTGATGLLGRQVVTAFRSQGWTAKGMGLSRADGVDILKVDLGSTASVAKAIDEIKFPLINSFLSNIIRPLVIVHCAAQRYPDEVDRDPEGARALNVAAARSLASLAAARDILLVYISTDYVFPGRPGEAPYEADATPGPTNLYGQTKLDGEAAVLEASPACGVVLRVPVLYGHAEVPSESAVNVLMDAVWRAQTQGSHIKMDHWALRHPTNTEDVARVCHDVAVKYLACGDRKTLPRILQFSSEDRMTKYEICQRFGEIMGLSTATIEPDVKGNDPNASVQRPFDCHLSTAELKKLGIDTWTSDFSAWWRREVGAFRK